MESDEAEKKQTKMAMARLRCSGGRTRQLHDAADSHVRAMPTISVRDGQISRFQEQRKPAMLDLDITVVGLITALATSQVATAGRSGVARVRLRPQPPSAVLALWRKSCRKSQSGSFSANQRRRESRGGRQHMQIGSIPGVPVEAWPLSSQPIAGHRVLRRRRRRRRLLLLLNAKYKMQGIQSLSLKASLIKSAVLKHIRLANPQIVSLSRFMSVSSARIEEHGFESTTIADVLKAKGKSADGSWLWCTTDETVYDAVKSMTQHNVGALVVVKPGEQKSIAGIITERDYLRKIIVQGRSSKSTKVGDIMTEENKLITVTPDTKVLKAMQLMTDNRIRHIPVINEAGMMGMVSIGDVVRAVVSEHREELDRLNAYIQGGY
ncbi:hypothetical protein NL676_007016 [Syzygium grande]|nr:hypothetical protein NL676_007016 [Syzygium grande]